MKKTRMVSTHLSTCPTFASMSPGDKLKTVTGQGACLHCSAWDHTKHKTPGTGVVAGDPKCRHKTGGVECSEKHGQWYHGVPGGTANTGSVIESSPGRSIDLEARRPGLYEVYSAALQAEDGHQQVGTVLVLPMVDPGSDTNYVIHDFARSLGLTGTPYSCFLKVVDTEYIQKQTAKYELDVGDKDGAVHRIQALGLDSITTLSEEPNLDPLLQLLEGVPRSSTRPGGHSAHPRQLSTSFLRNKII